MRESIDAKAVRLLGVGQVTILRVDVTNPSRTVAARVVGDHGTYRVAHEANRWTCSCPAPARCSHCEAVRRVVPEPGRVEVPA
jgi:hypothetical protein